MIRCPSCSQRFKVGEDLREKTVECGACETRFKITDEVIVRGRKFYPGERKDPGINRFQRVPLALEQQASGQMAARYGRAPDPALLEPTSPLRVLAGIAGVSGMIVIAMMLMFGGSRGGMLDGMTFDKRLMMAGFAVVMGIVLLTFANPKARGRALAVGLLLGTGVMAIPFTFTEGSVLLTSKDRDSLIAKNRSAAASQNEDPAAAAGLKEASEIIELRAKIGTDPLVKEINRLSKEGSPKQAYGIWLRGLEERNRLLIRDYIFRATAADASSANFYPRGNGDFLMVVAGPRQDLQELSVVASALGKIEGIFSEISVIEVRVNNENFAEGPIEKLTNKEDPAFYDLNKRELESIDLDRAKRAVQRLAEAEPKVYRTDITRRFISLLGEESIDFKKDLSLALTVWAETPGPASDAAVSVVKELLKKNQKVPTEIVALIVKEKNAKGIPLLHELWLASPNAWEALYASFGLPIESQVLASFAKLEGAVRHSAIRLLGNVGGSESLPVLGSSLAGASIETKILLEKAQNAIRQRLAR